MNDTKIDLNGEVLTRMQSMTVLNTVKTLQMKNVCEGESNVSGSEPRNYHVLELVPGQAICFVILGR